MPTLSEPITKEAGRFYAKKWKLLPSWLRKVLYVLALIPFLALGLAAVIAAKNTIKEEYQDANSCNLSDRVFASKFLTSGPCRWQGIEGVTQFDDGVQPVISENFSGGRDIFFPVPTPSSFQTTISFIPLNTEKVNLAVNYGYSWRIIIGDGDYNRITMQRNQVPGKKNLGKRDWINVPEASNKKWIKPNHRLDPNKEIIVNIVSRPREGTSVVHVNATISGYIDGAIQKKDSDFEYDVETAGSAASLEELVGIGLLDPYNEGIRTRLIGFELRK